MKVKIPKTIKMLTHTYSIEFNPKELASTGCSGLTRHYYQKIFLDNQIMPPSELDQIFLHEVIHTIERHMVIKLDDADVDRLAEGLAEFLFTNLCIEFDWSQIKEIQ